MAITTSQASAFEDAVIALLQAEAALSGVQVAVGPLGDDSKTEYIQSFGCRSDQEWAAAGNLRKRETLTLTLEVKTEVSGVGEEKVKAARDRIQTLVTAIETALRTDVSVSALSPVRRVQVDSISEPDRGIGSARGTRAELRRVEITGMVDMFNV